MRSNFPFLLMVVIRVTYQFTHTNFVVKKLVDCDKRNVSKFYSNLRNEGGRQYLDFDAVFPKAMDETVGVLCDIETSLDEKVYAKLFTIRERNCCASMHKYMGEFAYALEQSAGIAPGVCPIPKRKYRARNHYLDFSKISLQTFPFGHLRLTIKVVDNDANSAVLFCITCYIDNVLN
ncbi:uncharacterized protein LOC116179995 [Photinus pyralis]|uniref:uncharacterized protein LOC116179995 n=1 Tax=Photinus pyralis TaxID=7054 RepID=UPI001266F8C4|nr:uncharacterized protein LOC116179995 [Photinus pyralis]